MDRAAHDQWLQRVALQLLDEDEKEGHLHRLERIARNQGNHDGDGSTDPWA